MPFTVSHAAAVLPIERWSRRQLPLTALMVGSMAPDFGYFFSREESRQITHSFAGLFTFSLPMGLLVWLFYIAVLEKATITLLSDRWHTRFAHTDALTPQLVARASIAIVLGAVTHLLWDAFTHRGTFVTNHFPALLGPVPGMAWLPIYHALQGISSVVGLAALALWMRHLHRQPARSLIRPYAISRRARHGANWLLLGASLIAAFVEWLPFAHANYDDQWFAGAAGLMSGFFVAWCCIAVTLWYRARRNTRHPLT
jgi:membrane-bound metal-dependent hydrolase YbcI (DUF457 family)